MPQGNGENGENWIRYGLALEASEDGFWDWDLVAERLWGSSRWQSLTGVGASCSPLPTWLERVHPGDRPQLEAELHALRTGQTDTICNEHRVCDADGQWRWVKLRGVADRTAGGTVRRVAGSLRDNTERRMTDALTGLANRQFFAEHLERRIERGFRHADWNFAVLSLALVRFETVSETLGSAAGDRLLVEVAKRLQDRVSGISLLARLNGAEFLVCLEMAQNRGQAEESARGLAEAARPPFLWQGHRVVPQMAIGIAEASCWYSHPEEMIRDAEAALMHARDQEPPGIACYAEGMREQALETLELQTELERAIREGELTMFYQPEVDLETHQVVGFEALARWRHARRGLLLPWQFIPLAEETGLIVPLGQWGLREACGQLAKWRAAGHLEMRNARMSVNLSARQLEQRDLVRQVAAVLDETGLPAACLRLEITESSLIADAATAQKVMQELEELGVGLHMDDFGTGYSSLEYLQRFPFDTLKIDRSFVQGVAHDPEARTIVSTILELARSFGMDVVAEGIEDAAQLKQLKEMGCPCGQGYYFARPMEAGAIDALVRTREWQTQGVVIGQA